MSARGAVLSEKVLKFDFSWCSCTFLVDSSLLKMIRRDGAVHPSAPDCYGAVKRRDAGTRTEGPQALVLLVRTFHPGGLRYAEDEDPQGDGKADQAA